MKITKISTIAALIALLSFSACKNNSGKQDKISTNLIDNPNTGSSNDTTNKKIPIIKFENVLYKFGKIAQGEQVHHKYRFKNVGNATLIISSARGSCGCTVPTWPKDPIQPGDTASIDVTFNSNGKEGQQHKTVTIVANTEPNTTVVALSGYVMVPGDNGKDAK